MPKRMSSLWIPVSSMSHRVAAATGTLVSLLILGGCIIILWLLRNPASHSAGDPRPPDLPSYWTDQAYGTCLSARLQNTQLTPALRHPDVCDKLFSSTSSEPRPPTVAFRVACVGDSITFGNRTDGFVHERLPESGNYPAELEHRLNVAIAAAHRSDDTRVEVKTFARPGRTAMDGANSFRRTPMYFDLLRFQPHIIILMLGTNDARTNQSWSRGGRGLAYGLTSFLRSVATRGAPAMGHGPSVVLVAPPPVLHRPRSRVVRMGEEVLPSVRQVAAATNALFIDAYTGFLLALEADGVRRVADTEVEEERTPRLPARVVSSSRSSAAGKAVLFDGVHPTPAGCAIVAGLVFHALQTLYQAPAIPPPLLSHRSIV